MNRRIYFWGGLLIAFLPFLVAYGAALVGIRGLEMAALYMFLSIPVGGVIAAIGFFKEDTPVVVNAIPQDPKKQSKYFLWTGLLFIVVPTILQTVLAFHIGTFDSPSLSSALAVIGSLIGFAAMFCTPLGFVLLIVGAFKYFKK